MSTLLRVTMSDQLDLPVRQAGESNVCSEVRGGKILFIMQWKPFVAETEGGKKDTTWTANRHFMKCHLVPIKYKLKRQNLYNMQHFLYFCHWLREVVQMFYLEKLNCRKGDLTMVWIWLTFSVWHNFNVWTDKIY